jgi:hypothetical protein
MGWWSEKRNDYTKRLIVAGRGRQHHKQCKGSIKKGSSFRLRRLLRVFGEFSPSSQTAMCTALQSQGGDDVESSSQRGGFAIRLQKSQPIESVPTFYAPRREPHGPTEKYGCMIPRTKSACPRNERNSWRYFEHLETIAHAGRYEKRFSVKSIWGQTAPVCGIELS